MKLAEVTIAIVCVFFAAGMLAYVWAMWPRRK